MPLADTSFRAPQEEWDRIITKSVTETVTASTTLQNDDELFFTVLSNIPYIFDLWLVYDTPAPADFKSAFTISAGTFTRGYRKHWGFGPTTVAGQDTIVSDMTSAIGNAGATGEKMVAYMMGYFLPSSAATINFQWAQTASDAGNTMLLAGSQLKYRAIP